MSEIAPIRQRRARRALLTDIGVSKLPRKPKPYFHPDPQLVGHGVRVRPSGPGAFTVIVRDPYKRQRWVKVGSTDAMKIAEARDIARSVIRRVEQGLAPFEAPPTKPDSVEAVAEAWLKRHVHKRGLRTAGEIERVFKKYVLPHVGNRSFVELKRRDIAELLDHIEDRHGAHTADAALAHLRSMATWVQSRDDDYVPPFTKGMRRVPKQARARSRTLTDAELRAVWAAAGVAGAFGALVQLLLLTGQRLDKVVDMRFGDVSRDGVWTIRTAPREKGNLGSLVLPAQGAGDHQKHAAPCRQFSCLRRQRRRSQGLQPILQGGARQKIRRARLEASRSAPHRALADVPRWCASRHRRKMPWSHRWRRRRHL